MRIGLLNYYQSHENQGSVTNNYAYIPTLLRIAGWFTAIDTDE